MGFAQMHKKWFSGIPKNAKKATTTIGSGTNGAITITADVVGTEGNSFTIQAVAGSGNEVALSAVMSGTDIVVTLGTDGAGALDGTKNTAKLIAEAIDALEGVTSSASGTGATAISSAVAKKSLSGGQYATPAKTSCFIIIEGVWYIAENPVSKWDISGWKSAEPTAIV